MSMSTHCKNQEVTFTELVLSILRQELDRRESERVPSRQPNEWLTEADLADLLQCSTDTLRAYAMREEDPLPYGKVGEMRRYHREDVDDWLRAEGRRDRERRLGGKKKPKAVR